MSGLEFGISLQRRDGVAEEAQNAEALGYDFVAAGEHVFFHGPTTNGLISLAAAAAASFRLGSRSPAFGLGAGNCRSPGGSCRSPWLCYPGYLTV
jgi:hypothetical protein